ncbi:MAG: putative cytokinin riboside 5'-monophosphate phosphoribohydrolase [Caldimonas sp.]|uniref:LOG family protein n=1 Tax=Caldimonas taiwanensis TaxID=307483 RepID=UPI0007804697|nr:TIGR00730 family Rossman fold protein [Caldimonas taiwanensis]GIX25034.1 MAG: putative cytokinin riboside 5'-monophosphate phosphoribohydrolase [Caldimonas sp.]
MSPPAFSLCVYCGSRTGANPAYADTARALGRHLARTGTRLIYGGGRVGLMGLVADAALAEGGTVIGVIPQSLMDREVGHQGLTELRVVQTMHERKRLMAEQSDAFLALPGGIGTFEELFEVWTWRQLGYHDKPIGLLNVEGYYDPLIAFLGHTVEQGFLSPAQHGALEVGTDPAELVQRLRHQARHAIAADDYRPI